MTRDAFHWQIFGCPPLGVPDHTRRCTACDRIVLHADGFASFCPAGLLTFIQARYLLHVLLCASTAFSAVRARIVHYVLA